jgi:hypothetical protein
VCMYIQYMHALTMREILAMSSRMWNHSKYARLRLRGEHAARHVRLAQKGQPSKMVRYLL